MRGLTEMPESTATSRRSTCRVSGTIAALGDTLFHATSLAQGFQRDFSDSPNTLLRLWIIHPAMAAVAGAFLLMLAVRTLRFEGSTVATRLAEYLLVPILLQFAFGLLNLLLLTPLWLQILHLFTADLVWITLVLLSAEMLGYVQPAVAEESKGAGIHRAVYEG